MFEPNIHLTDHLAAVAQNWVEDFRQYYSLDLASPPEDVNRDDWQILKALDTLAGRIVAASRTLQRDELDLAQILDGLNRHLDLRNNDFFRQSLGGPLGSNLYS